MLLARASSLTIQELMLTNVVITVGNERAKCVVKNPVHRGFQSPNLAVLRRGITRTKPRLKRRLSIRPTVKCSNNLVVVTQLRCSTFCIFRRLRCWSRPRISRQALKYAHPGSRGLRRWEGPVRKVVFLFFLPPHLVVRSRVC